MSLVLDEVVLPEAAAAERRPVMAVRLGRGRLGGSTMLDLLVQLARAAGRPVLVGDGDVRNPTLSGFYPPGTDGGATRPQSDSAADVKEWLTDSIADASRQSASLVIDLGGGDRLLQEYGLELDLPRFCRSRGIDPLALFFCGPDADDFEHVVSIWRAGYFRPERSLLMLNENLIPQGRSREGAFQGIFARPEFPELVEGGMRPVTFPRLPPMEAIRKSGLSFLDAAAGRPGRDGKTLDPVREFMVTEWLEKVQLGFAAVGAEEWLP